MAVETRVYMDTNVLRYFGTAFADLTMDEDLRDRLLVAPISVMELLSQLATHGAPEVLLAIQAMLRVFNPQHTGVLPWSDDFFRMSVFDAPPKEDVITSSLNNAINNCLSVEWVNDDLKADAHEMQRLLDVAKTGTTDQFAALRQGWMVEGLSENNHRNIFAHSIARRAGVPEDRVNVDTTILRLEALYTFEKAKLTEAANIVDYKPDKHENDVFDAELLVYLADLTLHLLTSDTGFRRAAASSQFARIHIVSPDCLRDRECATQTIRDVLYGSGGGG